MFINQFLFYFHHYLSFKYVIWLTLKNLSATSFVVYKAVQVEVTARVENRVKTALKVRKSSLFRGVRNPINQRRLAHWLHLRLLEFADWERDTNSEYCGVWSVSDEL